jgi:hypothetical protein
VLAALTVLPLRADLEVALAKGRQPYRLASGGAQAQAHENSKSKALSLRYRKAVSKLPTQNSEEAKQFTGEVSQVPPAKPVVYLFFIN